MNRLLKTFEMLKPWLFIAAVSVVFVAAVVPWKIVLMLPDDLSFYWASSFAAEGHPRVSWERLINLEPSIVNSHFTAEHPGPPMQFVPTCDGSAVTEKPPGYVWWLTLLRSIGVSNRANVIAFFFTIPAAFFLLRRLPDKGLAYGSVGLFLLSPVVLIFGYQPYIPTFLDTAALFLAFALYAHIAAGGRGAIYKTTLLGAILGYLCLTRVTHWPIAAVFALAVAFFPGQARAGRWRLSIAFVIPLAAALGILAWYNNSNFGSPWRSGYYFKVNADDGVNGAAVLITPRRIVIPPVETALAAPMTPKAIPNPNMAAVGGDSRRAWIIRDNSYLLFRGPWSGVVTAEASYALRPPLWSRVAPKGARVDLDVYAGGKCVYRGRYEPGAEWRDIRFRYRATRGEDFCVACRFNDAGRRLVNFYLTPINVESDGSRYRLSEEPPAPALAAVVARNIIAVWPYLLIILPGILLIPLGWSEARRSLPGATFGVAIFTAAWVMIYYAQIKVFSYGNFLWGGRYYAPLLVPIALIGPYALARRGTGGKWATFIALVILTAGVYLSTLIFAGAVSAPWLSRLGAEAFFLK